MPEKQQGVENTATATERRASRRVRVSSLIYVDLGNGNGGIVTNISQSGLTLTAAGILGTAKQVDEPLEMQIQLPGIPGRIAATGQIVWRSTSGREAGIRFVDLEQKASEEIANWTSDKTPKDAPKPKEEQRALPKMQLPNGSVAKKRGPRFSFSDVAISRVGPEAEEEAPINHFPEADAEAIPETEAWPSQIESELFVDAKKVVASAFENPAFTEEHKEKGPADHDESKVQAPPEEVRQSRHPSSIAERRLYARRPILLFTYAVLGEDNGGLVFNLGEGGLALTAAAALRDQHFSKMRFRFPDSEDWIETEGHLAWVSDSGKEAGIEFVGLAAEARARIREWVSQGEPATDFRAEESELGTSQSQPAEPQDFAEGAQQGIPAPPPAVSAASFENRDTVSIPSRSALFMSGIKGVLARAAVRRRVAKIKPPRHRVKREERSFAKHRIKPQGQVRKRVLACTGVASLFAIGWIFLQRDYSNEAGRVVARNTPSAAIPSEPEQKTTVAAGNGIPTPDPLAAPQNGDTVPQNAIPQEDVTKTPQQNLQTASTPSFEESAPNDESAAHVPDVNAAPRASDRQERGTPPVREQRPRSPKNITPAPVRLLESKPAKDKFVFTEKRPFQTAEVRSTPNKDLNAAAPPLSESPVRSETAPFAGKEKEAPPVAPKPPEIPEARTGVVTVAFDPFPSIRMAKKGNSKKSRRGQSLQMGHLVLRVDPVYPEQAKQQGIEGTVKVHVIFNREGTVQSLIQQSGPPLLVQAAMKAIGQWRYSPTILGGQAMETEEDITVQFRLSNAGAKN